MLIKKNEFKVLRKKIRVAYHNWKRMPHAGTFCVSNNTPTKEQRDRVANALLVEIENLRAISLQCNELIKELEGR